MSYHIKITPKKDNDQKRLAGFIRLLIQMDRDFPYGSGLVWSTPEGKGRYLGRNAPVLKSTGFIPRDESKCPRCNGQIYLNPRFTREHIKTFASQWEVDIKISMWKRGDKCKR